MCTLWHKKLYYYLFVIASDDYKYEKVVAGYEPNV